jgi:P27 family predicted phage terminase small subunit
MPTPPKRLENTSKHWTNREIEARERAEQGLRRSKRVVLKAPDWLSDDARKVWDSVRRKLRGIELLDSLDTDMLAIYCDAVAQYRNIVKLGVLNDDLAKQAQAWARLTASYAEKLGLTPNSRARLAKKKAESEPVDELAQLLDDVSEFVNGGME